ncbi:heme-binding protein [Mycolicibacterium novocastrense]|nr:heme-binding protein [Mycolicibacterium novocastrense]
MSGTRRAYPLSLAVVAGAALLGLSPLASAEPANCTSADLEGVRAGVEASTSAYLFTRPDLNGFMSTLRGMSRQGVAEQVKGYMAGHPQESAEMAGIRQPLMDLRNHCADLDPTP